MQNLKQPSQTTPLSEKVLNYSPPSRVKDTDAEAKVWCNKGRNTTDHITEATENVRKAEAAEISSTNVLSNIGAGGISPSAASAKLQLRPKKNSMKRSRQSRDRKMMHAGRAYSLAGFVVGLNDGDLQDGTIARE